MDINEIVSILSDIESYLNQYNGKFVGGGEWAIKILMVLSQSKQYNFKVICDNDTYSFSVTKRV